MRVAIVDYGMGNLQSVRNAFEVLGCSVVIARQPADLEAADRIVLPGVGAFGDAMTILRTGGWTAALDHEVREKRKPFIGLCLGMQLLASEGTEHGAQPGLAWIPGVVTALRPGPDVRVPHIGWNDVAPTRETAMYTGLTGADSFYFLHSYVFHPNDPRVINARCSYGENFPASLECGNIWATQYHPEKSQKAGLRVLANFAALS